MVYGDHSPDCLSNSSSQLTSVSFRIFGHFYISYRLSIGDGYLTGSKDIGLILCYLNNRLHVYTIIKPTGNISGGRLTQILKCTHPQRGYISGTTSTRIEEKTTTKNTNPNKKPTLQNSMNKVSIVVVIWLFLLAAVLTSQLFKHFLHQQISTRQH